MSTLSEKVRAQQFVWDAEEFKELRHLVSPSELEYLLKHHEEWLNWKARANLAPCSVKTKKKRK